MIEIFKTRNEKLISLKNPEKNCWINLISPSKNELNYLRNLTSIPEDVIDSLRDMEEIPYIEKAKSWTFVIIRTSQKLSSNGEIKFITIPLGLILSKDYIISICYSKNQAIENLKKQKFNTDTNETILRIILSSTRLFMQYLLELNREINLIEKMLKKPTKNKEVLALLDIKKSLVYAHTSLASNQVVFEKISKNPKIINSDKSFELIEDVIDENQQAISMASIYTKVADSTTNAFSSIISNNLNTSMKLLTSLTIILMIPTLVASYYGMNVDLPFDTSPLSFPFVVTLSLFFTLITVLIFRKKKYF